MPVPASPPIPSILMVRALLEQKTGRRPPAVTVNRLLPATGRMDMGCAARYQAHELIRADVPSHASRYTICPFKSSSEWMWEGIGIIGLYGGTV